MSRTAIREIPVQIPVGYGTVVDGDLGRPERAAGLIVFAHGSGSSRFSQRNRAVAHVLHEHGFATLLLDLLTRDEERIDALTREFRFDIDLLAHRVIAAIDWSRHDDRVRTLPVGCFGASTGAAAALVAAAERPDIVRTVVSRGGRPDLAGDALRRVKAPTLLMVGGNDEPVIQMNREARAAMTGLVELVIIPGASHLFEEPGTMEQVTLATIDWCRMHLVEKPAN
jgi:pimeloyl-ACP methyl ester carboxylesterase